MKSLNVETTHILTEEVNIKLTGEQIIDMLRTYLDGNLPYDATIVCNIPSGGDYSGMSLDIKDEPLITVSYTITTFPTIISRD